MNIFLSICNGYREDQHTFETDLCNFIEERGFTYSTVSCLCNKGESPLMQIIDEINKSKAVISLAFDRKHVYLEYNKEISLVQRLESRDVYYTSPWIHVECAIAKALNKPLLLLVPGYIQQEGVVDLSQDWYPIQYLSYLTNTDKSGPRYEINKFSNMEDVQKELINFLTFEDPRKRVRFFDQLVQDQREYL